MKTTYDHAVKTLAGISAGALSNAGLCWNLRKRGILGSKETLTADQILDLRRDSDQLRTREAAGAYCPECLCGYPLRSQGARCGDLSHGQGQPCRGILAWRADIEVIEMESEERMAAIVRIHRSKTSIAISTNASTEQEFLLALYGVLAAELLDDKVVTSDERHEQGLDTIRLMVYRNVAMCLPQVVDICSKLRGYKANVVEHRVIVAGEWMPDDVVDVFGRQPVARELVTA